MLRSEAAMAILSRIDAGAVPSGRALDRAVADRVIETDIPARLDALRWSGFHTRIVAALGITWILDGLEVTLAGALSGALKESPTLHFSNFDIGFANSAYLAGAVLGALGFGWLTDRIGRKKLFFITLALYLMATAATALSWSVGSYALFRFLTGAGIGGEYTAINSTIQELVPARYRGWTDLVINGSFWIGAAFGAVSRHRAARSRRCRAGTGLAAGLSHRRQPWARDLRDAAVDSGKPPLADDPRPAGAGAGDRGRDRSIGTSGFARSGNHDRSEDEIADAQPHPAARGCPRAVLRLSPAFAGRVHPDGGAGVFLQRHLLHLCAGADRFLRHRLQPGRLVYPAVRGRQFPGPAAARPPVRHAGTPRHDRADLRRLGNPCWRYRAICSPSAC